jgi:hypothetical protein
MKTLMTILTIAAVLALGSVGRVPVAAVSQTGCVPAPSGLIAWWPGDGDADDIVGGHHGTLVNGVTFAPGLVGQAFSFDGVNDFVNVPHAPDLSFGRTSPITVDLWAFRTGTGSVMHLIGKRLLTCGGGVEANYQLALNNNSGEGLGFGAACCAGNEVATGIDLPLNTWTHLAGTFDGPTYRFYIDGQLVATAAGLLGPPNTSPLKIGGSGNCATFAGLIDEVEIYNCTLSDAEIEAIYNANAGGRVPPVAMCQNVTKTAGSNCQAAVTPQEVDEGSNDPDGGSVTLSLGPPGPYPVGTTSVTLTVIDDEDESATCTATVTVVDETSPTVDCPAAITVGTNSGCTYVGPIGSATATDHCDSSVSITNNAPASFPLGPTTVTWTATDDAGNVSTCAQVVTVVDDDAPTVSCSVTQSSLWPPNHNLANVGLSVSASDSCDANLTITVQVYGDEDDEEPTGDGTHSPDAKDIAPGTLRLRAERKGDADGRVYLIVVKATDDAGNVGVACVTVVVPKSQSQADVQAVNAQAASARSYCLANNGAPPPGYFVIGDGPVIGPKQ